MLSFPGLSARVQGWLFPWPVAVLALLAALGSWSEHRSIERERTEALTLLDPQLEGWLTEEAARDLRRERDPTWIRLRLARSRVAAEMDPTFVAASRAGGDSEGYGGDRPAGTGAVGLDDPDVRDASVDGPATRLEQAADLAAGVLAERPSIWQAPMLLGAATYLARSETRDPRLFTAYRDWEAPLELALSLAPAKPEPKRFLAVAYLELWPAVSDEKRRTARELIGEAFRDPGILRRLAGIWLAVVADREEAFAPIPPDPESWRHVGILLAREREWRSFVEARRRLRAAQEIRGRALLEQAELRTQGGDLSGARELLLRALTLGEPSVSGAPLLLDALRRLPPGPVGSQADAMRDWLLWALDLCLYDHCPLPASALERLTGLADGLEPPEAALAALIAGRLPEAERLERRSDRLWHPSWSPFHLAMARELVRRGELDDAAAALDRVHPSWTGRALYTRLAREVRPGEARPEEGPSPQRPRGAGATWPAGAWRPATAAGEIAARRPRAESIDRVELWLGEELRGLRLTLAAVPVDGAVLEVRLDGRILRQAAVGGRRETDVLTFETPIPAGLHLLETETLAGGRVQPGAVHALAGRPGVTEAS